MARVVVVLLRQWDDQLKVRLKVELVVHFKHALSLVEKGGAGPSSLHTTLEGPTENVNARWM